jgi:hypothetical protein
LKLRILTSAITSIISSLVSIYLYKYYSNDNNDILFIYVTSQQIAGLATIFFFYGANFEIKDKFSISAWKIIVFSILVIPFFPILSITCLLFSRVALQKFGKLQSRNNFYKIALVFFVIIILFYLKYNWLLFLIIYLSLIPYLFIKESIFQLPNFLLINKNSLISILLRTSIDLALLFPMILINLLTKYFLLTEDYLEIQKIIFCLSGLAIATTILEKIIFDTNLFKIYNIHKIRNNFIMLIVTYIGVALLAFLISIEYKYWWYLIISPAINFFYTELLTKIRSYLKFEDCFNIALKYFIGTLFFATLASFFIILDYNPINSIIICMFFLSLYQLQLLIFLKKI